MRTSFAFAAILVFCGHAGAQDIARSCAAEADAKGLQGQPRMQFESDCKTRHLAQEAAAQGSARHGPRPTIVLPGSDIVRAEHNAFCLPPINSFANGLLGACIPCVLASQLVTYDGPCTGR
jgi:hypothetical protein